MSFRFLFTNTNKPQVSGYFNIGYGIYNPIIPKIISPGIYFEAGLGLDWMYLFGLFSGTNEPNKNEPFRNEPNKNEIDYQVGNNLGSNLGLRLFNLIDLGIMDINLFIGYNLSILLLNVETGDYGIMHNPLAGASITFRLGGSGQPMGVGLEYAYYIPTTFSTGIAFHHIALVFRAKTYWD
jgi:hypothetical protein